MRLCIITKKRGGGINKDGTTPSNREKKISLNVMFIYSSFLSLVLFSSCRNILLLDDLRRPSPVIVLISEKRTLRESAKKILKKILLYTGSILS